jgi:hypothetical protein
MMRKQHRSQQPQVKHRVAPAAQQMQLSAVLPKIQQPAVVAQANAVAAAAAVSNLQQQADPQHLVMRARWHTCNGLSSWCLPSAAAQARQMIANSKHRLAKS